MPDGSLRISTKIDNSKIDKQILELQNKIKKLQINNEKNDLEKSGLQEEINKYNDLLLKADEYKNIVKELKNEKSNMLKENPSLAVAVDTPEYANIKRQITEIQEKYRQATEEIDKQSPKIEKTKIKLQEVEQQQIENNSKLAEYNKQLQDSQKKQIDLNYSTEGIGKSVNKGITKILKYGMALLSIRSIYGVLSNAMNSWLSGNSKGAKQIKSDIDYMKNAIGGALSPILKYIVNLLYQALGFTGALIKVFTGVDIFAGSVADYMKSTTSSASKTNKELKKQLTSFDKINKLNDNESNTSGGGSGVVAPSQDLSSIMEKYTEQAENLKKCFEEIKDIVVAIGVGIATWKIADALGASTGLSLGLTLTASSLYFAWKGAKGFQDGEISSKDILEAVAGTIGTGIGVGIIGSTLGLGLAASTTLGLSVALFVASWELASYGQSQSPDWVKALIGDVTNFGAEEALMNKLGIPKSHNFTIEMLIYMPVGLIEIAENLFPGIKNTLLQRLKEVLWDVADEIEKIPIIGQTIANGIRGAIQLSGQDMTRTLEETTTNSIETAKTKINEKSLEAGGEAGTNWMSEMKNKIDTEKKSLQSTIEETISDASNNSNNEVEQQGKDIGENYIDATKEQIEQSKESLSNSIMQTTNEATDRASNNTQENGMKLGGKTIDGIKLGQSSQTNSLSNNVSEVVREANNSVDTSSSSSIGSNIVSGINNGVNNNKWSLFSTMTNLGNRLLNNFKTALGIHSPSREMASLAKFIPLGIAEGIDSTEDKAIGSMKNLVYGLEDTMSEIDYSNITEIPKISKNAISYIPKQSISTNEIQRSIVGTDNNVLNKVLSVLQSNSKGSKTITIPLIIDGEEFIRKTIQLNDDYNLATNGGGL